jgi:hypothetical protein
LVIINHYLSIVNLLLLVNLWDATPRIVIIYRLHRRTTLYISFEVFPATARPGSSAGVIILHGRSTRYGQVDDRLCIQVFDDHVQTIHRHFTCVTFPSGSELHVRAGFELHGLTLYVCACLYVQVCVCVCAPPSSASSARACLPLVI